MRVLPGTRPQIAKLIKDIEGINDSDTLYEYVRDIASFYTSEHKSRNEILIQHEMDIEVLVRYYNIYNDFLNGYKPQNELERQMNLYREPNPRYEPVVSNIRQALEFLIWESSKLKIFLPIETLESLGLWNIKRKTFPQMNPVPKEFDDKSFKEWLEEFRKRNPNFHGTITESLYDYAIHFYKMYGYIVEYPDIPKDLQRIFKYNKENYQDFCDRCKGKDLESVALVYDSVDYLDKSRAERVILRHFITNLIDPQMERKQEDKYYQRFRRCLGKK